MEEWLRYAVSEAGFIRAQIEHAVGDLDVRITPDCSPVVDVHKISGPGRRIAGAESASSIRVRRIDMRRIARRQVFLVRRRELRRARQILQAGGWDRPLTSWESRYSSTVLALDPDGYPVRRPPLVELHRWFILRRGLSNPPPRPFELSALEFRRELRGWKRRLRWKLRRHTTASLARMYRRSCRIPEDVDPIVELAVSWSVLAARCGRVIYVADAPSEGPRRAKALLLRDLLVEDGGG